MRQVNKNRIGASALVLYGVGTLILVLTNPQQLSPIALITPFITFFGALCLTIIYVTLVCTRQERIGRKGLLVTGMFAGSPMLLLLLQSVGQLSLRDILTLVLLLAVLGIYIARMQFST